MKNRNFALDIIRSLACILVIIIHSPIAVHGVNGFLFASMTMIGSPCIGLFFMVSGYLLLPTDKTMFPFLKKRIGRVLFPTLFWTGFYLFLIYLSGETFQGQSWRRTLISIPFTRQGCGFLWFMYALMGLYVLAPMVSHWIESATKREFQLVLGLWLITTSYSLLRPFVVLTEDTFGMLYYFTGYAGYFLLGAYIRKFQPKVSFVAIGVLYLLPYLIALYARLRGIDFLENSFGYLCLMTVMQTYALFLFVTKIHFPHMSSSKICTKVVVSFSNCSFGIYLMHKFVMVDIIKQSGVYGSLSIVAQILLGIMTTALVAWVITYVISLLPYGEYVVGVSQRKRKR